MIQEHVVPAIVAFSNTVSLENLSARPATPKVLTMDPVVVVIIDNRVVVVSDSPEGPIIKLNNEIVPSTYVKGGKGEHSKVTTVKGVNVAWIKDTSCACGSRLKTWRPMKHLGSINDPGPDDD